MNGKWNNTAVLPAFALLTAVAGLLMLLRMSAGTGRTSTAKSPEHVKPCASHPDNTGYELLMASQYDKAITWFRKAVRENPGIAVHQYHLGLALQRTGDLDGAVMALDRAISLCRDKNNPHLAAAAAELAAFANYALGKTETARQLLATIHDPSRTSAIRLARRVRLMLKAEKPMEDLEQDRVVVRYDRKVPINVASKAAMILDMAIAETGGEFQWLPSSRCVCMLYADAEDYRLATGMSEDDSGGFDGRIHLYWRGKPDLDNENLLTIRHEYAHLVVNRLGGPQCPVWIHEGIAVALESTEPVRIITEMPSDPSPDQLGSLLASGGDLRTRERAYALAGNFMRRVFTTYGAYTVRQILITGSITGDFNAAFKKATGRNVKELDNDWRN